MKIQLRTNFRFRENETDDFSLTDPEARLIDLLVHIERLAKFKIVDSRQEDLTQDFEIRLNGEEIWFHPGGLKTPLKEGDHVEIQLLPLGGGS